MRRALFLDRDGVLNIDRGYLFRSEDFIVIDGVFETLRRAAARDFALVVVTNQSGIARGYYTEQDYLRLDEYVRTVFAGESVMFTDVYYCPHHPDGVVSEFRVDCDCRKPKPGMFMRAAQEHGIDLHCSIMVGDKDSDIEAARAAGLTETYRVDFPRTRLCDVL